MLDNFLQKMKKLNVMRSGDAAGEYVFNVRMVRLYLWLETLETGEAAETKRPGRASLGTLRRVPLSQ